MAIEKRKFRRVPFDTQVTYRAATPAATPAAAPAAPAAAGELTAAGRDVSEGGVRLVLSQRMPRDSELELTFRLPARQLPISVRGRVAWVEEFRVAEECSYDTGIAFVRVDPADAEAIEQHIRRTFAG